MIMKTARALRTTLSCKNSAYYSLGFAGRWASRAKRELLLLRAARGSYT